MYISNCWHSCQDVTHVLQHNITDGNISTVRQGSVPFVQSWWMLCKNSQHTNRALLHWFFLLVWCCYNKIYLKNKKRFWSLSLWGEKHFSLRQDRRSTHRKKRVNQDQNKESENKRISSTIVAIWPQHKAENFFVLKCIFILQQIFTSQHKYTIQSDYT